MTWTAGADKTTGTLVTASNWNNYLGATGSLMETATAKVTTAGDIVYATGANALARLGIGTARYLLRTNSGATAPEWFTPPACRVFHNADQAVASTSLVTLAFNSERFDTDTMHDTVTNNSRITFNTAGVYAVSVGIHWSGSSSGNYETIILLNGTTAIGYHYVTVPTGAGAGPRYVLCAPPYKFAAADYVQAQVRQDSGGSLNVQVQGNWSAEFSAVWQGPG